MGFGNGGLSAQGLFQGAMTGLTQGIASIALNYAVEELDWNPLLANIGFSAIATGIEGMFSKEGIFKHMFDTYKDNTLNMLGNNPTPDKWNQRFWKLNASGTAMEFQENLYNAAWGQYHWQESVYISQILDFSNITKNQGLEVALNTYATALFNGIAINSITNVAKIGIEQVGTYIKDKLDSFFANSSSTPEVTKIVKEGNVEEYHIQLKDPETGELGLIAKVEKHIDPDTGQVYFKFNGYDVPNQFSIYGANWKYDPSYGEIGVFEGYINEYFDNFSEYQKIDGLGRQSFYEIRDENDNVILIISPREDGGYNKFNSYGEYVDAFIEDIYGDLDISIEGSDIIDFSYGNSRNNVFETDDLSWLSGYNLTENDLNDIRITRKGNEDGSITTEFYWANAPLSEDPWDPNSGAGFWANNPEFIERLENHASWRGYRTNAVDCNRKCNKKR